VETRQDPAERHFSSSLRRSCNIIRPVRSRANSRHLQFFSTAAERCGCAEREAIGQNVSNLMPKPDRSQHYGYMTRYRASGERHIIRMPAA
jgi:two-component system sensor kinase FixL